MGDCWIAITLADSNGLILTAQVGKHTYTLIEELKTYLAKKGVYLPPNPSTITLVLEINIC